MTSRRANAIWRARADEAERTGRNVLVQPSQLRELIDLLEDAEDRASEMAAVHGWQ